VDKLINYLKKYKSVSEIPRGQRYLHRPELEKIFRDAMSINLQKRRMAIREAVEEYGYRQQEIANYLGLHYSSISRIVKGER